LFFYFGTLYSCFAYPIVYAMSTRPPWQFTRIIPLKSFKGVPPQGQRPCKTMPQPICLPTPSHSRLLLDVWKRNFCARDQSHQHFAKWHALRHPAGAPASRLQTAPCSLQQHKHPDSKAPIDILQPHQHPGPKVFQRAEGRFWAVQCFEYGLIRTWAGGQSVHPSLRGAYAKSTRSLRLFQSPLAEIWWNIRLKQEPYGPYSNKQVESEEHLDSSWHGQLADASSLSCSAAPGSTVCLYRRLSMNEPGAFEPFVNNIGSILKREIATPIMYEQLKY
jgi:hypothetical protein